MLVALYLSAVEVAVAPAGCTLQRVVFGGHELPTTIEGVATDVGRVVPLALSVAQNLGRKRCRRRLHRVSRVYRILRV